MKSADLIGHIKLLLWRQLDGCSVTRLFLSSVKRVASETRENDALLTFSPVIETNVKSPTKHHSLNAYHTSTMTFS